MQPNDILCRMAIYPRILKEEVFDDEQFLNFSSTDNSKTVYVLSVVSQFSMRTDQAIHNYGKIVADAGNNRIRLKSNGELPEVKKQFYLGFYRIRYNDVRSVNMRYYSIHVKYRPESNCNAHFQIEMWQTKKDSGTKSDRRRDRTIAINKLTKFLSGPCTPIAIKNPVISNLIKFLPKRQYSNIH